MEPTQSFTDVDVNITSDEHDIIGREVSVVRVDTIQAGDFLRLSAQRFPDRDCFVFGKILKRELRTRLGPR
jgi:hypothetical protein